MMSIVQASKVETIDQIQSHSIYQYLIEGDSMYIDEEYEKAVELYIKGNNALEMNDEDSISLEKIKFLLNSHLCSAYMKINQFKKAYDVGSKALDELSISRKKFIDLGIHENHVESLKKKLDTSNISIPSDRIARGEKVVSSDDITDSDDKPIIEEIEPLKKLKIKSETERLVVTQSTTTKKNLPAAPKYQYYQNETFMTISILEKSIDPSSGDLTVQFFPQKLIVQLRKEGHTFTVIYGTLFDKIVVDKSKVKFMEEKVLIKLRKTNKSDWHELFGVVNEDETENSETQNTTNAENEKTLKSTNNNLPDESEFAKKQEIKASPYASKKDWNAIEKDLKKQEAKEKPEGDEALNKLFQDIYGRSDDATRRAMVKSFQTSGGTVLSTNWNEVKETDYEKERQAPKGMEWKNWEGEKLKQKE